MTTALLLLTGLLAPAPASAGSVPAPPEQIAAAVLAAPEELRDEARVLGYNQDRKLVPLREGTNELICLADDPAEEGFETACYHKDLEPYMARGRELRAMGITGKKSYDIRWPEVENGKIPMPREPRTLYVLQGTAFEPATGTVTDAYQRWVLYWPFATAESTGLSTKPGPGAPWLMYPGTAGAHIMISPPKQ